MKTTRTYIDLGAIFDELFDAASHFSGNIDYYPCFSYPPMNIYFTEDKSLNFEFALAGFDEKNIDLSFSGDYMVFSARIENTTEKNNTSNNHYLKRRLKLKDIEKQKYYVPVDKYAQEKVRAVFKNGILKVTVPPKPEKTQNEEINITIITAEPKR